MTRQRVGELAINTVLTVIGAIAVLVLSGAWSLKEDKGAHDRDYNAQHEIQQRTLDVVCQLAAKQLANPQRACQP